MQKRFKKLGWFKTKFIVNVVFQHCLERFYYLGFSKVEDVSDCFEIAMADLGKFLKFLKASIPSHFLEACQVAEEASLWKFRSYMERTWVGRSVNEVVMHPIYEIRIWNAWLATESIGLRTNNSIEAWNLAFNQTLNCKGKPGVGFTFLYVFKIFIKKHLSFFITR